MLAEDEDLGHLVLRGEVVLRRQMDELVLNIQVIASLPAVACLSLAVGGRILWPIALLAVQLLVCQHPIVLKLVCLVCSESLLA